MWDKRYQGSRTSGGIEKNLICVHKPEVLSKPGTGNPYCCCNEYIGGKLVGNAVCLDAMGNQQE